MQLFDLPPVVCIPEPTEFRWFRVAIHNVEGDQTISVPRGTTAAEYALLCSEVSARFSVPARNILSVTAIPRPE